jgi:hypothetical protein
MTQLSGGASLAAMTMIIKFLPRTVSGRSDSFHARSCSRVCDAYLYPFGQKVSEVALQSADRRGMDREMASGKPIIGGRIYLRRFRFYFVSPFYISTKFSA